MKKTKVTGLMALGAAFIALMPMIALRAAAPTAPTNLVASSTAPTSATITWNASVDVVAGYKVFRNGSVDPIATTSSTTLSYMDTGLIPATLYSYAVSAFDAMGSTSPLSASASVTTLADTAAPSLPGSFAVTPLSSSKIKITWATSTDNVAVVGYRVYRNDVNIATTTSLSYEDTGLASSTSYSYKVAAFDAAGNYSMTAPVAASTLSTDALAPSIPTGLAATAISSSQINLAWTASTDNVGVTGYRIFRNSSQIGTSATNSYSNTGLSADTTYVYTVSAYDAEGNASAQSATATAKTLKASSTIINKGIRIVGDGDHGRLINFKSNAKIKVIVYATDTLDPKTIIASSVTLGGAPIDKKWKAHENRDRKLDMVYEFRAKDMVDIASTATGTVAITFKAKTTTGQEISYTANVRVKNWSNWKKELDNARKLKEQAKKRLEEAKKKLEEAKKKMEQARERVKTMTQKQVETEKVVAERQREEMKRNEERKREELKKQEEKKEKEEKKEQERKGSNGKNRN